MVLPRFTRPTENDNGISSPNLYVANCGPAVGLSFDTITSAFATYGAIKGVYPADDTGTRVVFSFLDNASAHAAFEALNGRACVGLGGRILHIKYSVCRPISLDQRDRIDKGVVPVCLSAQELGIPYVFLVHDFVTAQEEQELVAAVDCSRGNVLRKEGFSIMGMSFAMRNVNTKQYLGELPSFVSPVLERISLLEGCGSASNACLDQLTVNEYPPGVGLSPHIDTHSAFEGSIFSLSLAGPCIMEFRKYSYGDWISKSSSTGDRTLENSETSTSFLKRSIYLPPRSILLLSGEARYAWHHYIPHHKVDFVNNNAIRRSKRRVSFTIREVRKGPCRCPFPQYCDSQK